jgi:capsular exopolysaccharide synthesis family protein
MTRVDQALRRAAEDLAPLTDLSQEPFPEELVEPQRHAPPSEPPAAASSATSSAAASADDSSASALLEHVDVQLAGKTVVDQSISPVSREQYRRLAAALHQHSELTGLKVVMVTSAAVGEGKTLTAANLALTLSESYKKKVLLIDADLRRPSVHEVLSLPNASGLTDALKTGDRSRLRFQTLSPLFSVLTAGRPDSDPMAGLVSETMSKILTEAAEQFDWVIVDTPPVALLPDANLLAAMIDTALLVVSANATPYPLVARAVQAIGEQRILGVVLNRMAHAEMIGSYNYYGYGGYYYGGAKTRPTLRRFLPFFNRKKKQDP